MNKRFKYIVLSAVIVLFTFIIIGNIYALDKSDGSSFSTESPFDQRTFSTENNGDQVLGGPPPDPPGTDDDGTAINSPINDSIVEIFGVLLAGVLILKFRKKIIPLKE